MNLIFAKLFRQLGATTFGLLLASLACFGVMLLCALLGLPQAVASFKGVTLAVSAVFVIMLALFLVAALVGTTIRWVDRKNSR